MQVAMTLKRWSVELNDKTQQPRIVGTFGLNVGTKEIATQSFNTNGYGEDRKEIQFSPELLQKVAALEADIKAEMERLLC